MRVTRGASPAAASDSSTRRAVASPSASGSVARITSRVPSRFTRSTSRPTKSCAGSLPSAGLSAPISTW